MNDEPDLILAEDPFQEFQSESAKPVSICDDNLLDSAAADAFQKGQQSGSLPVEAGGDIFDDLVVRVRLLEILDLSLEVRFLVLRRDSGVDDSSSGCRGC